MKGLPSDGKGRKELRGFTPDLRACWGYLGWREVGYPFSRDILWRLW